VLPPSPGIALMMEVASTSETSVDNYFTRQYIPEDKFGLNTRSRENLKTHIVTLLIYSVNGCQIDSGDFRFMPNL
jgi:hypothetical protein